MYTLNLHISAICSLRSSMQHISPVGKERLRSHCLRKEIHSHKFYFFSLGCLYTETFKPAPIILSTNPLHRPCDQNISSSPQYANILALCSKDVRRPSFRLLHSFNNIYHFWKFLALWGEILSAYLLNYFSVSGTSLIIIPSGSNWMISL